MNDWKNYFVFLTNTKSWGNFYLVYQNRILTNIYLIFGRKSEKYWAKIEISDNENRTGNRSFNSKTFTLTIVNPLQCHVERRLWALAEGDEDPERVQLPPDHHQVVRRRVGQQRRRRGHLDHGQHAEQGLLRPGDTERGAAAHDGDVLPVRVPDTGEFNQF